MRRISALDRPSVRDEAMLAEVLRTLQFHLEQEEATTTPATPDVEDLVSRAVAELHRLTGDSRPMGGIAPVLGAGVVQELLRRRKEAPPQPAVTHKVDATR